jgi:hypothetical protein
MNPVAAMVTAAVTAAITVTMAIAAIVAIVATTNIRVIGGVEHRRQAFHAELSIRVSPDELHHAALPATPAGIFRSERPLHHRQISTE